MHAQILEGMRATRDELLLQEVEEREAGGGHAAATPGSPAVAGSSAAAAGGEKEGRRNTCTHTRCLLLLHLAPLTVGLVSLMGHLHPPTQQT